MQRKDEILAKKAKLAELRRQREEREQRQKEGRRESHLDDGSGARSSSTPRKSTDRQELDTFIETLVGERSGTRSPAGTASPARKSRPTSTLGAVQVGSETYEQAQGNAPSNYTTASTQTQDTGNEEPQPSFQKKPPIDTYEKGVQTSEDWNFSRRRRSTSADSGSDEGESPSLSPRAKKLSRRQREREEELRQNLRKEIEEELEAAKDLSLDGQVLSAPSKFPARGLTIEELNAVTSSEDFLDFVERSSKVIEKALDQDYDLLADYALDGVEGVDDDDEAYTSTGKKGRRLRQIAQFWDERWSKKRMISDLGFSPKVGCHLIAGDVVNGSSFPNFSSQHTPRTHQRLRILQASSRYGTCTLVRVRNIASTVPPTS